MRWRLRRMGNDWRAFRRRNEQTAAHIRYKHKTCPECGAVQDHDAKMCGSCGTALSHRRWQVLERIGVSAPKVVSVSALLGVMFAIAYLQLIRANGGGGFISIDTAVLADYGGYHPLLVSGGDWWRPATACFMHAGLWHIGFNLFALAVVGPRVSQQFGGFTTAFLFLVTGILGNLVGGLFGVDGISIGASGGVMGLIGAACAAGHRDGTSIGRQLRNDMLKWTAYVIFFSFLIGGNNWAHAGGFVAGGAFGLLVAPRWMKLRSVRPIATIIGLLCIIGSGAATYAVLVPPESEYVKKQLALYEAMYEREYRPFIERCDAGHAPVGDPDCEYIFQKRRQCTHGIEGFLPDGQMMDRRAMAQAECNVVGPPRER